VGYLVDTCTLVWLTSAPERLGAKARQALDQPGAELFLSDASIWEICLKWQAKKLVLPTPPRSWLEEQRRIWELERLALSPEHLYRSTEIPAHHRDPFDRLLVAQAIAEGHVIVTPDAAIGEYPVPVLW
jgi:PIN domain nuclease of toxin-antitoxin system